MNSSIYKYISMETLNNQNQSKMSHTRPKSVAAVSCIIFINLLISLSRKVSQTT